MKGATLVEEEFMEEEKVKSEIYVYYMKTVGELKYLLYLDQGMF